MELSKKKKTIKYFVYFAILLLSALLQNVSGIFPAIGNARCFFLLPVCVVLGLNEDERVAAVIGLFGGFFWDMVSAQHMGFNCIFLMFTCYIFSALITHVIRNTFVTGLIAAEITVVAYCLLYWLLFVLINSAEGAGTALGYFYVPCMLYTAVLTPFIEFAIIAIKSRLSGERQLDD